LSWWDLSFSGALAKAGTQIKFRLEIVESGTDVLQNYLFVFAFLGTQIKFRVENVRIELQRDTF